MTQDPLVETLRRELGALRAEAARDGVEIPVERLERVERLSRLVEIGAAARKRRKRWPIVVAFGGTLLLATVLFFVRIPAAEVELEARASVVSFRLSQPRVLFDSLRLAALGAAGMASVEIPASSGGAPRTVRDAVVRFSAASDASARGTVTLAALALPAGTQVALRKTSIPRQHRLTLAVPRLELRVSLHGPVDLAVAGQSVERLQFAVPRPAVLRTGPEDIDLDLEFDSADDRSATELSSQLPVAGLSLFRVEEFTDTERTVVRQVSSLLDGKLYLESLDGAEQTLRKAQGIRFAESSGVLRALELQPDAIGLKFRGRVRGLESGSLENPRSLMPTVLEWLRARHGISLLWGTGLYLFSLLAGVLRWLEVRL